MDRQYAGLTKVAMGVLTFNSALAVYNSWGDAGSVGFVLAADTLLLLLFLCLREFERGGRGRRDAKIIKAAVWALTTLLTAMFASRVAPTLMPLAVGAIVFLCFRDVDHHFRAAGEGGDMDVQCCALAKVGFAVLTCNSVVDAYGTRRDAASAAFVFVSYAVLVIQIGLFVRAFARARSGVLHGCRDSQGRVLDVLP